MFVSGFFYPHLIGRFTGSGERDHETNGQNGLGNPPRTDPCVHAATRRTRRGSWPDASPLLGTLSHRSSHRGGSRLEPSTRPRASTGPRAQDRVRFVLERLVLRGLRYRLLLAAAIIATVALVGGGLALLLDGGFDDLSEAVWWAFLRLTDPGYLGDDEGIARRTISTVVTVLGYLLFLGLLIAILTQWLNGLISKLESGVSRVALSRPRGRIGMERTGCPAIVAELLDTGARLQRFLARHGAQELRIVILAEQCGPSPRSRAARATGEAVERPAGATALRNARCGSMIWSVSRSGTRRCSSCPARTSRSAIPNAVDAQTVKTLLSVSTARQRIGLGVPPLAVAASSTTPARLRSPGGPTAADSGDRGGGRDHQPAHRPERAAARDCAAVFVGAAHARRRQRPLRSRSWRARPVGTRFRDLSGSFPQGDPARHGPARRALRCSTRSSRGLCGSTKHDRRCSSRGRDAVR